MRTPRKPPRRKTPLRRAKLGQPPISLKKTPLRKQSKKRAKENKEYLKLVKMLLEERPNCEACAAIALYFGNNAQCAFKIAYPNRSTQCHHRKGRGKYFLIYEWFLAVCDSCHKTIEANKNWARSVELILYK